MEENNKTPSKIVETYAEDMAKVIEDDKSGLIKKIINEEEKHEIEKINLSPESKKNRVFMLTGFLFIALSLATLSYFILAKETPPIPIEKQFAPLIFIDKNTFLEVEDLKKEQIIQTIWNKINTTQVKRGGVEGIYLTRNKKVVGLFEFTTLLGVNFNPSDKDLFYSDHFLMGAVNARLEPSSADPKGDFFLLLKARSISDVFDSMRAWEKKIFSDLHKFFGINISSDTKYLLTKEFKDDIIQNKNARILYDKENKIILMYIFADENSVIIAGNESAAREIMFRLSASRVKK